LATARGTRTCCARTCTSTAPTPTPSQNRPRWGGYSAAVTTGSNLWFASEGSPQTCIFTNIRPTQPGARAARSAIGRLTSVGSGPRRRVDTKGPSPRRTGPPCGAGAGRRAARTSLNAATLHACVRATRMRGDEPSDVDAAPVTYDESGGMVCLDQGRCARRPPGDSPARRHDRPSAGR
jgi:hypothetical protein